MSSNIRCHICSSETCKVLGILGIRFVFYSPIQIPLSMSALCMRDLLSFPQIFGEPGGRQWLPVPPLLPTNSLCSRTALPVSLWDHGHWLVPRSLSSSCQPRAFLGCSLACSSSPGGPGPGTLFTPESGLKSCRDQDVSEVLSWLPQSPIVHMAQKSIPQPS